VAVAVAPSEPREDGAKLLGYFRRKAAMSVLRPVDDPLRRVVLWSVVGTSTKGRRRPVPKKQSYHHGDLPRALVGAALELIEARGPEAFTLREAAASVGVTHGAAYRHFEDKTALLAAVSQEGYRALAARLGEAAASTGGNPRERIWAIASAYVEFALERPAHYRVMWGPRLNEDGRFPSLEAAISDAFDVVVGEMKRGQDEGVFRKPPAARELAIGMWVAAHGYVELVARRRLKVKSQRVAVEYFHTLFEPFLDGLACRS
jgi:AcrR family transcriptional regulator